MAWPYGTAKKKAFRSALHGDVDLERSVWVHVVDKRNRKIVELNAREIGPTLRDPDEIRRSQHARDKDTYFYYREPRRLRLRPGVTVSPSKLAFVVCIDVRQKRIKTMYVTNDRIQGDIIHKRRR